MDKDAVQNQPIIRYEDEQLIETEDSYNRISINHYGKWKRICYSNLQSDTFRRVSHRILASEGAIYKKKKLNIYKLMIVKGLLM